MPRLRISGSRKAAGGPLLPKGKLASLNRPHYLCRLNLVPIEVEPWWASQRMAQPFYYQWIHNHADASYEGRFQS